MFSKILIANRGEIALRIIRACKELGIETAVVFSKADENALYIKYADEAICIGPPPSAQSYLDIPRIMSAAEIAEAEAIHPGYGFLAENSHFAEVCRSCGIEFIGPTPETINTMGDKANARTMVKKLGIPIIPGSLGVVDKEEEAIAIARKIGYPVILKATAGGGGRGMRVAIHDYSLKEVFQSAQAEAKVAFKNPSLYVEKYIEKPRHVEFQILGDKHGNIIHLGERDCSLQRRHQKLIEESPCPVMTPELREEMGEAAKKIAQEVGYIGAGTIEFLLDRNGSFYFIEMNTRIQVEHPVTEMLTGVDIVKEQIRVAADEPLLYKQEDIKPQGAAIECRINAEDPDNDFKPMPGKITFYSPPGGPGVRVDSHVYTGYLVPPNYDSMIGKLIVHRATRNEAILCMKRALKEYIIEGIKTTIPLHLKILSHSHFIDGEVETTFIEKLLAGPPFPGW